MAGCAENRRLPIWSPPIRVRTPNPYIALVFVQIPVLGPRFRILDGSMFVALSCFTIRNNMAEEVHQAFVARPHLVDAAPGFLGMQVMSPIESPEEIWLLTRWADEPSYRSWHQGHGYHDSHKGIPKGLKLVPKSAVIRCFNMFAE